MDKVTTIDEAVKLIEPGMTLALGGMTLYRRPIAFVRALLKHYQQSGVPNRITLLSFTSGLESDLLVGSGVAHRTRTCYFGLEVFGLAPMFTYLANRGEIDICEETEASLAFGLRAAMAGTGFMPGRGWLGTDLPRLRPDVKTVTDPYNGEELIAFPAIHPDVAVIHALTADEDGNAQIGDNRGVDIEFSLTAKKVIITAEKIVPKLERADIVGPFVQSVANAPNGAYPTSCHPLYALDGAWLLNYIDRVSDPESLRYFLDEWLAST
jgi:glutaconate CoA-transferase, subunit A